MEFAWYVVTVDSVRKCVALLSYVVIKSDTLPSLSVCVCVCVCLCACVCVCVGWIEVLYVIGDGPYAKNYSEFNLL